MMYKYLLVCPSYKYIEPIMKNIDKILDEGFNR